MLSGFPRKGPDGTADACSVMVAWSSALCGNESCETAINMIREVATADVAFLHRLANGASRPMLVSRKGKLDSRAGLAPVSFASVLTVAAGDRASQGCVLRSSDFGSEGAAGTEDMLTHRLQFAGVREAIVILLESRPGHQDVLELHYSADPSEEEVQKLRAMAAALTMAWSLRLPGTATKLAKRASCARGQVRDDLPRYPILSAANPAGLTRSEFRVCLLVLEGLPPKAIADVLDVQLSTIHTHLRAVCAKTETGTQLKLVHRLIADERNARRLPGVLLQKASEGPRLVSLAR